MKLNLQNPFRRKPGAQLVILLASFHPDPKVLEFLAGNPNLIVREAFTNRGVLQSLPHVQLVILGDLLPTVEVSDEVLHSTLDRSEILVVSQETFLVEPEEWLGRAHLTSAREISCLPTRQVNFTNWSGGVGKTTLALAVCKRFVQRTGLPAALLELSLGGSALQSRISTDLPEFFAIATRSAEPALWNGVSLYPMDGRSFEVLWNEDAQGVRTLLDDIRRSHTLFVVDAFPGHPLFVELVQPQPGRMNFVVTTPRDDTMFQAQRLMQEIPEPHLLVLNMAKTLADRAENGMAVVLPYQESWAQSLHPRLADPLLELAYAGWKRRHA